MVKYVLVSLIFMYCEIVIVYLLMCYNSKLPRKNTRENTTDSTAQECIAKIKLKNINI